MRLGGAAAQAPVGLPVEAGWAIDGSDPLPGLHEPLSVAAGPDGRVYIGDAGNARVVAFDRDGRIVGAWGRHGESDGRFGHIRDIAWAGRSLWVVDDALERLDRFDAEGRLELTIPTRGAGILGPAGIGGGADGTVWVADGIGDRIVQIGPSGAVLRSWGASGEEEGALNGPVDVAVRAGGDVILLEGFRWQRFTADGAFVQARGVPGRDLGQFQHAWSVAADGQGGLVVSDRTLDRLTRIDARGAAQALWGGPGVDFGRLRDPRGVAFDEDGAVLVAEAGNGRVQRLVDGAPSDVYGRDASDAPHLSYPLAVAAAGPDVLVADTGRSRVARLALDGRWLGVLAGGGLLPGQLTAPDGVARASDGTVFVADTLRRRVSRFGPDGRYLGGIDIWGPSARPVRVGLLPLDDGGVLVADKKAHTLLRFDALGTAVEELPRAATPGQMGHPSGVARLPDGRIAVADWFQSAVHLVNADGTYGGRWPPPDAPDAARLAAPTDVAVWGGDTVIVADAGRGRLAAFGFDGTPHGVWGGFGAAAGVFGRSGPSGLAVVGGTLVVADRDNHRLLTFATSAPSGWRRSDFADAWLSGAPAAVESISATLALRLDAPGAAARGGDGAAGTRLEGRIDVPPGPLRCDVRAPAGTRLWHDGRLVVDDWSAARGRWTVVRRVADGRAAFEWEIAWPALVAGEPAAEARLDCAPVALAAMAYLPLATRP